jgi:flagellar biosynthetic protein FlhB
MAENSGQDRTEEATPQRLRKAQREGQLLQSQEVPSAMILAAVVLGLVALLPGIVTWLQDIITLSIRAGSTPDSDGERFRELFQHVILAAYRHIGPLMLILLAVSLFSSIVTSGLHYCPKAFKVDFNRINPAKGIKNVISLQGLAKLAFGLLKLSVITLICTLYYRRQWDTLIQLRWASPMGALITIGRLLLGLLLQVLVAVAVIAGLDYAYQRWSYKRKMRMTKQEVKEEYKQHEGSPEVRSKRRQLAQELTRARMLQDVPQADVVITNPTHYAVALQYNQAEMPAPVVLAKGFDHMALKIKQIAKDNNIPIVERPSLARALYAACDIQQMVPAELFVAVAEVLAMIFRMRGKRKAAR